MGKEVKDLVDRFIEGDQQAFAELVRRYKKKIYAVAYRLLGNHLDADEVTQETFVRIYDKRRDLKSVTYFSSFILRIATNYCIDIIRRRHKKFVPVDDLVVLPEVQAQLADKVVSPDQSLENAEILSEIKKAIDRLPPKQKMTVTLHDIEGFSKTEIANALNCPQATVRSNLHIARGKLKKWLTKKFK